MFYLDYPMIKIQPHYQVTVYSVHQFLKSLYFLFAFLFKEFINTLTFQDFNIITTIPIYSYANMVLLQTTHSTKLIVTS